MVYSGGARENPASALARQNLEKMIDEKTTHAPTDLTPEEQQRAWSVLEKEGRRWSGLKFATGNIEVRVREGQELPERSVTATFTLTETDTPQEELRKGGFPWSYELVLVDKERRWSFRSRHNAANLTCDDPNLANEIKPILKGSPALIDLVSLPRVVTSSQPTPRRQAEFRSVYTPATNPDAPGKPDSYVFRSDPILGDTHISLEDGRLTLSSRGRLDRPGSAKTLFAGYQTGDGFSFPTSIRYAEIPSGKTITIAFRDVVVNPSSERRNAERR